MTINEFAQSKKWQAILAIIGIFAAATFIFAAGMVVGYRKAAFNYRWGDNYYAMFGESEHGGPGIILDQDDAPGSHGIAGMIIKVSFPFVSVEGPDHVEKVIRVSSSTQVVEQHSTVDPSGLSDGDFIVILGSPDASSSEIDAHFIRVLPPPPGQSASTGVQ